jgi:hypothetical protein
LSRLVVIGALLLLLEMLVMKEWKDVLRVGRMGEAKLEGASLVTSGLNTWGLSPISDMWGFGTDGGSGGLIITLGVMDVIIIFQLFRGYLELFVRQLAIFILVSKFKHLLNIIILNRHGQVLHYVNKIILNFLHKVMHVLCSDILYLAEEMFVHFIFLCPDICGVRLCPTQHLKERNINDKEGD